MGMLTGRASCLDWWTVSTPVKGLLDDMDDRVEHSVKDGHAARVALAQLSTEASSAKTGTGALAAVLAAPAAPSLLTHQWHVTRTLGTATTVATTVPTLLFDVTGCAVLALHNIILVGRVLICARTCAVAVLARFWSTADTSYAVSVVA